jgi:hypothetical protein
LRALCFIAARRRAVLRRRFGFADPFGIGVMYVHGPRLSNGRARPPSPEAPPEAGRDPRPPPIAREPRMASSSTLDRSPG